MVHMRAKPLKMGRGGGWGRGRGGGVLIMKSDTVPVVGHMLLSPGHGPAGGRGGGVTAGFSIKKLH